MNLSVIATVTAAAALIDAPATAYADPVPSTDEVVAIMAKLTDPSIPAANAVRGGLRAQKSEEAQSIDNELAASPSRLRSAL
jgi:hypothetical protein